MNKNILKLVKLVCLNESLFDGVFDDDDNDTNLLVSRDIIKNKGAEYLTALINKHIKLETSPAYYKPVFIELIDAAIFLYTVDEKGKHYIPSFKISTKDKNDVNQFINLLSGIGVKYVGFEFIFNDYISNNYVHNQNKNTDIDFKDLVFYSIFLKKVNIYNLTVDTEWLKSYTSITNTFFNKTAFNSRIVLENCFISDSVNIISTEAVDLLCNNIRDLSFIHLITRDFKIRFNDKLNYPQTNDLTGLPNGNYEARIYFGREFSSYNNIKDLSDFVTPNRFCFNGLPSTISKLVINSNSAAPAEKLFPYISFEGIPINVIKDANIEFHVWANQTVVKVIQCGIKEITIKQKYWKPNKKVLADVINSRDFFLNIYKASEPETKAEYQPPTNIDDTEEYQKHLERYRKDNEKRELKEQDDAEDLQLMIDLIKKYIKPGCTLTSFHSLLVKVVSDTGVGAYKLNKYRITTRNWLNYNYKAFIKTVILADGYSLNGVKLKTLIVDPVKKRREQINKKRKEQLKNKKAPIKQEIPVPLKDDNEIHVGIPGIEVIDYSDRAYAIFGNTYSIKDDLKDIGAGYNPRLNYKGTKKPGWIISKLKKDKLELILNN